MTHALLHAFAASPLIATVAPKMICASYCGPMPNLLQLILSIIGNIALP